MLYAISFSFWKVPPNNNTIRFVHVRFFSSYVLFLCTKMCESRNFVALPLFSCKMLCIYAEVNVWLLPCVHNSTLCSFVKNDEMLVWYLEIRFDMTTEINRRMNYKNTKFVQDINVLKFIVSIKSRTKIVWHSRKTCRKCSDYIRKECFCFVLLILAMKATALRMWL